MGAKRAWWAGLMCVVWLASGCGDDDGGGGASGVTAGSGGSGAQAADDAGGGDAGGALCLVEPSPGYALPDITQVDPDMIARAAAVIAACLPDDGVDRSALHLWDSVHASGLVYYRWLSQAQCLADATCGCAAVDHCLGLSLGSVPGGCAPGCTDGVFSACNTGGADYQLDCTRLGMACDPNAGCIETGAGSCTDTTPTCDGDGRPSYCESGVLWRGPDCTALGLACDNGTCVGTGAQCEASASTEVVTFRGASCTGNVLHACIGEHMHDVDCATLGPFACHTVGDVAFCGLGDECMPADPGAASPSDPPRCEGTELVYCHLGKLERVDCTTLGFTGCDINRSLDHFGCIPGILTTP